MSRILIAWELGSNFGHLAACLPLARALRERGHTVVFAVRETRVAAELLSPARFDFVQAPLPVHKTRLSRPPANFSEILLDDGYADRLGLLGMVRAWRSLVQLTRTDVLLADYAPTAMIAGYSLGVHILAVNTGFAVPPRVSPLPSIRPWEEISTARLAHADKAVEASIKAVMTAVGGRPYSTLDELYQDALLYIFPELDPYGPRKEVSYIGPISVLPTVKPAAWSEKVSRKILAYLRPDVAGFPDLMAALSRTDAEKICVIPGLRREPADRLRVERLQIFTEPVVFDELLNATDAFVSYGGSGSICQTLLAGVPMIIVPRFIEQYLTAKRAEATGAAVVVESQRRKEDFDQAIAKVFDDATYRSKAQAFAAKYAEFTIGQSIARAVQAIERVIVRSPIPVRVMNG